MRMEFQVDSFVAEFDARGRALDIRGFAEVVDELLWRAEIRVVLLLIDGTSAIGGGDDAALLSIERARLPVVCAFDGAVPAGITGLVAVCDVTLCSGTVSSSAESAPAGCSVSRVVPADQLVSTARSVARTIASRGPYATQLAKEAIRRGLQMPLEQALRFETDLTLLLQTTKDRAEGVRAFMEKRPPVFNGE